MQENERRGLRDKYLLVIEFGTKDLYFLTILDQRACLWLNYHKQRRNNSVVNMVTSPSEMEHVGFDPHGSIGTWKTGVVSPLLGEIHEHFGGNSRNMVGSNDNRVSILG